MAFKIKDGLRIGTIDVFNNTGTTLKLLDGVSGTPTNQLTLKTLTLTQNRAINFPDKDGTVAMTTDLGGAVNDASLTLQIGTAGATNTSVTIGTGTGFTANDADNTTYDIKLGPAIPAFATIMTGGTAGFIKKTGQDAFAIDTNSYSTTGHGHYVGTTAVQSGSANQALTGISDITLPGSSSGTVQLIPTAAAGTGTVLTLPATTGTLALTSQIQTVNDGGLTLQIGTAGATNTSVTIGTGTGFTANDTGTTTYDIKLGPAIPAFTTVMTGATAGFIKKTAQDTFSIDTTTYLSAEADTLQTVTTRGASSSVATVTLSAATASSNTTTGTLVVTGGVGIGGNANIGGNVVVTGDLTVNGSTTTINVNTVEVEDKNIVLGNVAVPDNTTADGGGVTLKGATDKTFNWINATSAWKSSEHIELAAGKDIIMNGLTSGTVTLVVPDTAGSVTLTMPASSGTVALTSQLPTVNDGGLTLQIGTAGATNTSVTIGTGTGFTANDATGTTTYDIKLGPAIPALTTIMTGGTVGFVKKTAQDTYGIDTATYLTAQSNDFGTVTVTDTDSGFTWAATGSAVADVTGDTLTVVSGAGIDVDVDATNDAIKVRTTGSEFAFDQGFTKTLSNPTANTAYEVDSWSKTAYRACKYVISITQGSFFQAGELFVFYNGSTGELTEYAVFSTAPASELTFTVVATGANVQLMGATPTATTDVVIKGQRTLLVI